jgi:hypothetical protein
MAASACCATIGFWTASRRAGSTNAVWKGADWEGTDWEGAGRDGRSYEKNLSASSAAAHPEPAAVIAWR